VYTPDSAGERRLWGTDGITHSTTKDMIATCIVQEKDLVFGQDSLDISTELKLCDVDQQTCDDDERLA
jgi:hypothetical protein